MVEPLNGKLSKGSILGLPTYKVIITIDNFRIHILDWFSLKLQIIYIKAVY